MRRWRWRVAVLVSAPALALLPAGAASAHPLGNFTVNHYDGLSFAPHAVADLAVVDTAEIPTEQARRTVDANHDGVVSAAERATYAGRTKALFGRQALHAWKLAFVHPESGETLRFEAPLPADFAGLLEGLRA